MHLNWKYILSGLALFAMALPIWARTNSVPFVATQTETISGVSLAPGNYDLEANDMTNKVTVERDGKVIAQVPCHWINLQKKPTDSEVLSSDSKVVEMEFSGQMKAATFNR